MKTITLTGGGSGVSELLPELSKVSDFEVTAIVPTFDSGGSTGRLREKMQLPAVGDFRKIASSLAEKPAADLLESRLENGHAVGNLALAFLVEKYGFEAAIKKYSELLGIAKNQILPISTDSADLVIELENGEKIVGEHLCDTPPKKLAKQKVRQISLDQKIKLFPKVADQLQKSDLIVVGPGSLFGSLLANFCVPGFAEAFARSKAKKVFVAPGSPEWGYRDESPTEIAARFEVEFDEIFTPPKNSAVTRWQPKMLATKIQKLLA